MNSKHLLVAAFFLTFTLFIGCDDDNPSGPSNKSTTTNPSEILGNYVPIQEIDSYTEEGETDIDTSNYDPQNPDEIMAISDTSLIVYSNNYSNTDVFFIQINTGQTVENALINGDELPPNSVCKISKNGDTLTLNISASEDGYSMNLMLKYVIYTGEIIPSTWPSITAPPTNTAELSNGNNTGTIDTNNTEDWYSFKAAKGATYTFLTSGNIDPYITLYTIFESNDQIAMVKFNDDFDPTLNAKITWTSTLSGNCYLQLEAFDEGDYGLSFTSSRILSKPFSLSELKYQKALKGIKTKK